MRRYLYLVRHAQSSEKHIGQNDSERELTPTGVKEALLIGSYLLKQKISLDSIMTSPAERARATAGLIGDALKTDLEKNNFTGRALRGISPHPFAVCDQS